MLPEAKPPGVATLDWFAQLSDADRNAVRMLSLAVYPPEQHAAWPGRHIEWSKPEWCVRVRDQADNLVSCVGVYLRKAAYDGQPVRIGGIGNVMTHPAARRLGFAGLGIQRAVDFFLTQSEAAFALLVCEPHMLGYYARRGWQEFGGRLIVLQHGVAGEFTLDRVMTHSVRADGPAAGTIDLCGPPW